MMDCKDARGRLWPPDQPRLARAEVLEARKHVDSCAACTEYFEQDRVLLDAYERLGHGRAPLDVREKVFDALAQARWEELGGEERAVQPESATPGWVRRSGWAVLLAAGIAVVTFGMPGAGLYDGPIASGDDGAVFVEDYLRRAVGQDHIVTSDPDEVGRFLTRELGMQVGPIFAEGLELESAEICLLEGRRGAMVVYKKDGAAVAHYIVPREGTKPRAPALTGREGPGEMPVVTWSSPAVEQALVGELSSEVLLSIARNGSSSD